MNDSDKISFFNTNLTDILNHHSNDLIAFIAEGLDKDKLLKGFENWPSEIKVMIVDSYFEHTE